MNIHSESDYIPYKEDQSKPRMELLPPDALIEIAKVMTFGSNNKYPSRNWELNGGLPFSRLYASLQRHLNAFWSGQDYDEETNLPSLAHAGACMLMILAQFLRHKGADDRFKINAFIENNNVNQDETTIKEDTELENAVDEVNNFPDIRKLNSKYLDKDSKYDPDEPVLPKPDLNPELIEAKMRELLEQNKSNFNNVSSEQEQSEEVEEDNIESEEQESEDITDDEFKKTIYTKFKFSKRDYMAIINHYEKPYKDFKVGYYVTVIDVKTKKVVYSFYSRKKIKKTTPMIEFQKYVSNYMYRNNLESIEEFLSELDDNTDEENEQVEEVTSKFDKDQKDVKEKNEKKIVHMTDSIEFDTWDKIRNQKLTIHVDIIYTRKDRQERYDYIYIDKETDKVLIQTYSNNKKSEQEIIDYYNYISNLQFYPASDDNTQESRLNLVNKTNVLKEDVLNTLEIYSENRRKPLTFLITYKKDNNMNSYVIESKHFPGSVLRYKTSYELTIDQLIKNIKNSFRI